MATKSLGKIISELGASEFANMGKVNPCGALEARKLSSGAVMFYWRVTIGSKTSRIVVGAYDAGASPKSLQPGAKGYSIEAARRAAEGMAGKHQAHKADGGYPALVALELVAKSAASASKAEAAKHTLAALLANYCDHIESLGRSAHKDARSIFKLHVLEAWPAVAGMPANQVTGELVADMMRRVLELGKGRTANKLRSYVGAAYQTARASRSKASVPVHFKAYAVSINPAADTEPDESQNNPDKNPLGAAELRSYWQAIKSLPGMKGAVLRLHLLTGGQRIEQLVNLKTCDVTPSAVTLYDGKGRPGKAPRPHTVPLVPIAAAALAECGPRAAFAISTDGGVTHLSASTLSQWAAAAAAGIPGFQTKRIRSGVETLLASVGISADHRGRLQSHGIAGVQARHYDGHDYLPEKRRALDALFQQLDAPDVSNVLNIRAA